MMTQARAAKTPENRPARAPRTASPRPAASAAPAPAPARPKAPRRRIQVRQSEVHGKGVFALAEIAPGDVVIEYQGELITWPEALARHPHDPSQPNHTFYFHIDDGRVIDGNVNGNDARWINHACEPNCEADEDGSQVFIKALRPIMPGEELFYDYGLIIDAKYTKKLKKEFECRCGFPSCRGTMLAPKDAEDSPKKKKKQKKNAKAKSKGADQAEAKAGKKKAKAKAKKQAARAASGDGPKSEAKAKAKAKVQDKAKARKKAKGPDTQQGPAHPSTPRQAASERADAPRNR